MPLPPDRSPTHEPLDLEMQWDLSEAIDDAAPDRVVSHELLEEVAGSQAAPVAHLYIAAALDPGLQWQGDQALTLHLCVGGCQAWGAGAVLATLLDKRAERLAAGLAAFDVISRGCVSLCERAPALVSDGEHGRAPHFSVTPAGVDEILAALLD